MKSYILTWFLRIGSNMNKLSSELEPVQFLPYSSLSFLARLIYLRFPLEAHISCHFFMPILGNTRGPDQNLCEWDWKGRHAENHSEANGFSHYTFATYPEPSEPFFIIVEAEYLRPQFEIILYQIRLTHDLPTKPLCNSRCNTTCYWRLSTAW